MTEIIKCPICKEEFEKGRRGKVYCSKECYKEAQKLQYKVKRANKHMDYQFELDMSKPIEEWEWTEK